MSSPIEAKLSGSRSLLALLRGVLRYHRSIGIDVYPRNADVESLLRWQPVTGGGKPDFVDTLPEAKGAKLAGGEAVATGCLPPPSLAEIASEVVSCHACELQQRRLYPVPGRGAEKMRLFVVGDWLMAGAEEVLPPDSLFGVEQDAMLSRMFAAIKLPMEEVFVTNVVKCALPASKAPDEQQADCCRSYLVRQLSAVSPEVILTMGSVATRAVLGQTANFTRIRGKMQRYQAEGGRQITVMATYHPTYLLRNPEVKQVAWGDLQLLARHLRLIRQ